VGSRFNDWIYWTSGLQLQLIITVHALNSFLITNLSLYFFRFSDWSLVSSLWLHSPTHGFSAVTHCSASLSLTLRPTVSRPVCLEIKHPSGAYDQIFITVRQLRVCWCGVLSLTRGRVCYLQLLLVLASVVILWSESRGTHDRILLSQIRDFHFRHHLPLAGLRCRYFTQPPHVWQIPLLS
jgi:hypothetical protein